MKKNSTSPSGTTPLANAELAVLDFLWQEAPSTAREVRDGLYPEQGAAQNGTVQRLLQRLETKGYVIRRRDSAVHLFSPTITRQTYAGNQLENLASTLTEGSFAPLITHLVEKNKISVDDIKRIRQILDEDERNDT